MSVCSSNRFGPNDSFPDKISFFSTRAFDFNVRYQYLQALRPLILLPCVLEFDFDNEKFFFLGVLKNTEQGHTSRFCPIQPHLD